MKTIITEKERGLKFKCGVFRGLLGPGKHRTFGESEIEVLDLVGAIRAERCPLQVLLEDPGFAAAVTTVEVPDNSLALHYIDGKYTEALGAGKYAFFRAAGEHGFTLADLSSPEIGESIPAYVLSHLPSSLYTKVEVAEHEKARLYYNGRLVRLLDAGVYFFWRGETKVTAELVDTRLLQLNITGQEMLTADKVTLRINLVATYRITDCIRVASEIDNYREQLHTAAQLALRSYVGRYKLDELLENKEGISEAVFVRLKEKESSLFLSIESADVKDIILPGEIREIMNTVLVAEKRAQANVITRREEVASTRSLLNTARLMEENPTLYRLKELEYVERICENVGSLTVNGSGDLLSELSRILHRKEN